jgi:hypothetical protein
MKDDARYCSAILAFDRENSQDPHQIESDGRPRPRELVQAERFSQWLMRLRPDAPEALWLAVRCQHIKRWEKPRAAYPNDRVGYLKWRRELALFHADTAEQILRAVGYDEDMVTRVRALNLKHGLGRDADTQTLEDVLCLSFLEHEFAAFGVAHSRDKVIDIVRKTWRKMSDPARQLALSLSLPPAAQQIVSEALQS